MQPDSDLRRQAALENQDGPDERRDALIVAVFGRLAGGASRESIVDELTAGGMPRGEAMEIVHGVAAKRRNARRRGANGLLLWGFMMYAITGAVMLYLFRIIGPDAHNIAVWLTLAAGALLMALGLYLRVAAAETPGSRARQALLSAAIAGLVGAGSWFAYGAVVERDPSGAPSDFDLRWEINAFERIGAERTVDVSGGVTNRHSGWRAEGIVLRVVFVDAFQRNLSYVDVSTEPPALGPGQRARFDERLSYPPGAQDYVIQSLWTWSEP